MTTPITFYYQPHRLRKSEAAFFHALSSCYPAAQIEHAHYLVDAGRVDQLVEVSQLAAWLERDRLLPDKKRLACLEIVRAFPADAMRVARRPSEISFDIVATVGAVAGATVGAVAGATVGAVAGATDAEQVYYWEYHEKQHARLTVDRPKFVYTPDGAPVQVPRNFQRLLRDLWRAANFDNYSIVWQDWFESTADLSPAFALARQVREFALPGRFSLHQFMHHPAS